ncbi:MAG: type II and III secretion system protein family protein [Massilia sp.]
MNTVLRTPRPLLACLALVLGGAAQAAPEAPKGTPMALRGEVGPRCSGDAAKPSTMQLRLGKSAMLRLPEPLLHRSVGNPGVVQAMLVSPDTLYLAGIDVGSTNMIIQGKSGACSVVDLVVSLDTAAFEASLAALMPDERGIRVSAAADALVLSGSVSDSAALTQAGELALAYVRRPLQALGAVGKTDPQATGGTAPQSAPGTNAALRVVNLLSVSAPQQVMLEVKIAEVSKSLIDKLEAGTTLRGSSGSWSATLMANFLTGTAGAALSAVKSNGSMLGFQAQQQDGLVRILAEPNVMAISGQEGTFLAGGKIYIPVAQVNNRVTLEEKEFGVGLRFTPTVLAGGRINLRVAPEVSELSREGVGVSNAGYAGSAIIPLITTRRASTTVQLYDGQSFAIGGLIKNNLVTSVKGLPGLAQLPILGALFRSTDYQQDRTELVFVVTPRLVKPLAPSYTLPTDAAPAPTAAEVMLSGRLEGRASAAESARSASGFELK